MKQLLPGIVKISFIDEAIKACMKPHVYSWTKVGEL